MENGRNLHVKETLFHINFQLRRSQEMYSKASKYRKFQSRAIRHTRINYSLVQAKAKVLIFKNAFCSQLFTQRLYRSF